VALTRARPEAARKEGCTTMTDQPSPAQKAHLAFCAGWPTANTDVATLREAFEEARP
jgi:hypothetical protein